MKKIALISIIWLIQSITYSQNHDSDWIICHDHRNGSMTFDLQEKNDEILGNRNPSDFSISFYQTEYEARIKASPITEPVPVAPESDKTIFYRLEEVNDPDAYELGSYLLKVIRTEVRKDEGFYCGNAEGYYQFKLADLDDGMLNHQDPNNGQDPSIHEVTYYLTEDDAENQVNRLDKTNWTNTIPGFQTIYVRVQRTDDYPCFHVKFYVLYIPRTLDNPEAQDETFCIEGNPSEFNYDLNNKDPEILNGANAEHFNILYFDSEADALSRSSEITQINGSQAPKTVYFRVEDSSFRDCFETGSFELDFQNGVQAKEPEPLMACDTEETGSYIFDLSLKDAEILNGQNTQDYSVSYFHKQDDARQDLNTIEKQNYRSMAGNTILYAKLSPRDEGCSSIVPLEIQVAALPQPELAQSYYLCEDNPYLELDGGDFNSWEWLGENYETIGDERNIKITEPGEYALSVTKNNNGLVCQNTIFFLVENAGSIGEIDYSINGPDNNRNLNISTANNADLEYSIDGINFQDSNVFPINEGNYTVYVRDKNGCKETFIEIIVPGYQTFFTPNGDGIHDNWEIIVTEDGEFLDVLIYDRYGKLLAQILSGKNGWDGTYNGKPMPSNDYWFSVEYSNGEILTGHFSLVRS
ncbi:T9SS type B sorting domain-containing protein [Christiangramia sabulilitoris]|uniref:T9SS type B sorting domain-containing protein n=1 Tax=Christiangramia sabulilitoris TaxID=2583991 RepID=A0A550I2P6_9FLAO|nr:T9SS type B sorting domain-containing protein [Christiangramia sabulilitoris]TRO65237.1 T9SS type B sorting domain-containing protein [Christiangramia sabulilitoris]